MLVPCPFSWEHMNQRGEGLCADSGKHRNRAYSHPLTILQLGSNKALKSEALENVRYVFFKGVSFIHVLEEDSSG